jgi:hypothetical protein
VDSLHLGKLHLRRVQSTHGRVISWHTFCRSAPLPRVVPIILYEGFLRRPFSPLAALRFLGQGRAGTLPAFRRVITPPVTFMPFHYGVAAPVRQLRIS